MTKLFRLLFLSIILLVVSSCEDSNEKSQSQIEFEQRQKNHFKKYAKNELLKSPKFLEIQNKFESDNNFKSIAQQFRNHTSLELSLETYAAHQHTLRLMTLTSSDAWSTTQPPFGTHNLGGCCPTDLPPAG